MPAACLPPSQVETLIELYAIRLERLGEANRFTPLLLLEITKSALKLRMWREQCSAAAGHGGGGGAGRMFLRQPSPEDVDHLESQQGAQVC